MGKLLRRFCPLGLPWNNDGFGEHSRRKRGARVKIDMQGRVNIKLTKSTRGNPLDERDGSSGGQDK
eukprot:6238519-Alexandrium_andersonii.AAC.1